MKDENYYDLLKSSKKISKDLMPTGITSSPKKQYGFLTNIVQTLDKPGNSKINLQQSVQILNIPLKGSPEKYNKFINESKYEFIKESS